MRCWAKGLKSPEDVAALVVRFREGPDTSRMTHDSLVHPLPGYRCNAGRISFHLFRWTTTNLN